MRFVVALWAALACAACGDDAQHPGMPDAGTEGDAMPDAPPEEATFTSYVIDLITNQTTDTAAPRPYSEVESLPDPDADNAAAYQSLF